MIKTIIFDFDGVIHDTNEVVFNLNAKFSGISPEEVKAAFSGNIYSDNKIKLVDQEDFFKEAKPFYQQFLIEVETLQFLLKNDKKHMSIITSNDEEIIMEYAKRNNITDYFKEVYGYQTSHSKVEKLHILFNKYDLDVNEAIFITDSLGDIKEGTHFGIRTIGVDFGIHSKETLQEGNPHAICSSWDEVQKIIDTL